MPNCKVITCKNRSETVNKANHGVTYHQFPSEPDIKHQWILATGRYNWFPQKGDTICSQHFEHDQLVQKKKITRLVEGAIPTVMLHPLIYETCSPLQLNDHPSNTAGHTIPLPPSIQCSTKQTASGKEPHQPSILDTPRKRKLKLSVLRSEQLVKRQRLQIRQLQQSNRRLKKKMCHLENIIKSLREQSLLTDEDINVLQNTNVKNDELKFNRKGVYSPEVKAFALTLHYYSPKAYSYVRGKFNTCLPHPRTLQKWYESIDANPGFTKESLTAIELKQKQSNYKIVCSLSLDEMAIRRRIEWDGKRFHGYVDFGSNIASDDLTEAKDALVFLVTAINANWKVPVGYFLVAGVNGEQRANLVQQCLKLVHETGVQVVTITCDGCPANFSMLRILGCKFDADNIKTSFVHPVTQSNVHAFLDACHMVKLIRNAFKFYNIMLDDESRTIKWTLLTRLHDLQEKEHLHLCNKLRKEHVLFEKNKMKVKLATQLLSNSVADALHFCEFDLKLDYFSNTAGTTCFLRILNNLFDMLNSKNFHQKDYKKPLNPYDKVEKFQYLENAKKYLKSLTLENGTKLISSSRKVGFIGLITCIESSQRLYEDLVGCSKHII